MKSRALPVQKEGILNMQLVGDLATLQLLEALLTNVEALTHAHRDYFFSPEIPESIEIEEAFDQLGQGQ